MDGIAKKSTRLLLSKKKRSRGDAKGKDLSKFGQIEDILNHSIKVNTLLLGTSKGKKS